jgi:glutamate synthase domain-containing protein 3
MQVICKITGEDKTSWLLNKWEKEREAKELQKKIARKYKLDKLIEELMTKDLSHKEFDKELNKICQEK